MLCMPALDVAALDVHRLDLRGSGMHAPVRLFYVAFCVLGLCFAPGWNCGA